MKVDMTIQQQQKQVGDLMLSPQVVLCYHYPFPQLPAPSIICYYQKVFSDESQSDDSAKIQCNPPKLQQAGRHYHYPS